MTTSWTAQSTEYKAAYVGAVDSNTRFWPRMFIWAATCQNHLSDCAPSKDSDQPGHLPNLIRVLPVRMKKAWVLSYPLSAQRRLWSDWTDAQADLSLRWAHIHFVGFVMRRLICLSNPASTAGPCPPICQSSRMPPPPPPTLEATQHHRPTQPPTDDM